MSHSNDLIANGYDTFYAAWDRSPTLRQIWRDHVTGPDYPVEFSHISFLPLAQLRALVAGLDLTDDQLLVDVACGAGGPGLWAATETGARLLGLDLSPVAVERARERATELVLSDRAEFRQASFEQSGLVSGSADAVMSVDALQYAPSKSKALAEVARIIHPGRHVAFAAFELEEEHVAGLGVWDDPVGDYRPVLEHAGFEVLSYQQIPDWQRQVSAGFGAVIAQREALDAELGESAAAVLLLEASITLELRPYCGHVLAVATRV